MKRFVSVFAVVMFAVLCVQGQTVNAYIIDMGEALVPYGIISSANCHSVEIDLFGKWGDYGIPDGINKEKPDELTFAVIRVNALRIFLNLSDLDEDKVINHAIFSMGYIAKHQKDMPYTADTPSVFIATSGLNTEMTVYTVDLDKVKAMSGQTHVPESQMGITIDERRGATLLFKDQAHADAFQKAIQKAIVVCKAQ